MRLLISKSNVLLHPCLPLRHFHPKFFQKGVFWAKPKRVGLTYTHVSQKTCTEQSWCVAEWLALWACPTKRKQYKQTHKTQMQEHILVHTSHLFPKHLNLRFRGRLGRLGSEIGKWLGRAFRHRLRQLKVLLVHLHRSLHRETPI